MESAAPPNADVADRMRRWLSQLVVSGASDLHLVAGHPPVQRLHGELIELAEPPLAPEETAALIHSICTPEALAGLEGQKDIDFSFISPLEKKPARFRANLFHASRNLAACLRLVPDEIPDFAWASFP